ncbi:MAG: hypothetical protein IKE01_05500 [Clostridia bacterium]|nr:hypothetical protein [Clostridia bacterium]
MAKQKAILPVRVRSTDGASNEVRARALKMGSISVTTHSVGPNQVESIAEFRKPKDAKEFIAWLHKKRSADMEFVAEQ